MENFLDGIGFVLWTWPVLFVLGVWKLAEILIWLFSNISISWG